MRRQNRSGGVPTLLRGLQKHQHTPQGFSLIELCVALAITAILVALVYPSYNKITLKSRRSEAHVALMQLAQSQQRWRASHATYANLVELNTNPLSPNGHYQLEINHISPTSFELVAQAVKAQTADQPCQVLKIKHTQGQTMFESGPSKTLQNTEEVSKRCWPS